MTKRSNPFVEDFIPQSKTHIGHKQFNNNEDRMQKVYEKTLHLLFKGAKKPPEEATTKTMDTVPSGKKDCMKQLLINKDGTLVNSSEKGAGAGLRPRPDGAARCSYCEAAPRAGCGARCARCLQPFCSDCCLFGSEGTEICVSCYG